MPFPAADAAPSPGRMTLTGKFDLDVSPIVPTHPSGFVRNLLVPDTLFNLISCFSLISALLLGSMPPTHCLS